MSEVEIIDFAVLCENTHLRPGSNVELKSKCTKLSRIAWPRSKFNFPFFRGHSEVFITFQRFWGLFSKYGLVAGIFEKMDFALSLAKNWPKKLVKNIIAKTSWRQWLKLYLRELETKVKRRSIWHSVFVRFSIVDDSCPCEKHIFLCGLTITVVKRA